MKERANPLGRWMSAAPWGRLRQWKMGVLGRTVSQVRRSRSPCVVARSRRMGPSVVRSPMWRLAS